MFDSQSTEFSLAAAKLPQHILGIDQPTGSNVRLRLTQGFVERRAVRIVQPVSGVKVIKNRLASACAPSNNEAPAGR